MKTNITTDNYEAYLLDYMDGNLSPDETKQLKAFVAAQGLDWSELTEELPRLEAPQIEFEDKERLKKHRAIVPLYVKIASAAAAAGLLLTVSLWPEKSMPKTEPIAKLKPILPGRLITTSETTALPPRTIHFVQPQVVKKEKAAIAATASGMISETVSGTISERVETPLLAQLEPQKATSLPTSMTFDEPDFDLVAYRMNTELALAQIDEYNFNDYSDEEDERDLSLIRRGILQLTDGRHDSFASLISSGLRKAKQDITEAATDIALAAYHRAEISIEETRLHWEEKRGE